MAKYVFIYHGGTVPETDAEKARVMDAWGSWLGAIGDSLVGILAIVPAAVASSTVLAGGRVEDNGGSNPISVYSLVEASDIDSALAHAKKCPILESGGSVEVAECFDM